MKIIIPLLVLFSLGLLPQGAHAQTVDFAAVDDSICIMAGDPLIFNVRDNDVVPAGGFFPVFLVQPSECFGMKENGDLYFLPGAGDCCGEHILRYRYEGCQPPNICAATIKVIVKCPKPDCFFVNLEDFAHGGDPNGNPDEPGCAYACENSSATFFVNYNISNAYNWAVTGGTYTLGQNPAEISVAWGPAGTGSVSVTVTAGNGESTTLQVCVVILPAPVAAFQASPNPVCLNSPVSFTNNSSGGNSFFWDFGDGNTSGTYQPTHTYATPGNYTVTLIAMNANYAPDGSPLCCCSDTTTMDLVVEELPGPNIYCISTLCAGDSTKYWTDATNCSTYTWSVLDENGLPWPFTGQGNDTICVQWGAGPVGTIILDVAGCDSAYCSQPVSVLVPIISPSVAISGLTDVCENAVGVYTVPKWLSVDYNWQVTGGTILSGQGTNTVVIQWGAAPGPGVIQLNYSSDFLGGLPGHEPEKCEGKTGLTINIRPTFDVFGPVPGIVCANSVSSFFATATPSSSYTWTITPTVTFSGQGTNFISVTWDGGPGTFTVTATPNNPNAYCNGPVTKVIEVVETPAPTGILGPVAICPGDTYNYFAQSAQSGVGFIWTVTGGTPATFTGDPLVVTWNPTGPYSLSLQQFSLDAPFCTSTPVVLTVNPKSINGPLTISGPPACTNSVQNYTAGPAQHPDAVYQWTVVPATAGSVTGGQGTANAQIQWNNTGGTATIQLTVTLCNNIATTGLTVTLHAPIVPNITQVGVLCPGGSAVLDAGAGFSAYMWSTNETTQTINISSGGPYTVTTMDFNGCKAVDTYQAVQLPGPVASISTGDPTVLCITPPNTNTVSIVALTGPGYTFAWFCNGVLQALPPTQTTFVHTNTNVIGTFNYWVVVTDANGCTKMSNVIQVVQTNICGGGNNGCIPRPHTLTFTAANQNPNCNVVNFTVTKSPIVTLTGWNFGDPGGNINTGSLTNAVHTYSKAGCFNVVLSATVPSLVPVGGFCVVTASQTVCVPLAADFTFSVNCQTATFTDLSTFLAGQGPVSWLWSFGDTNTSTLANPTHTYATGGVYPVTLTVTNAAGCQSSITKTVTVAGLPNPVITINPGTACAGSPVGFSATGANIISWLWNFGDGSMNGGQAPSHTYLSAGNYPVSLTVTDNLGCQNTVTSAITVYAPPPPDTIAWSPDLTVCAGTSVVLTAPPGTGYTYLWSPTNATTQTITVTTSGAHNVVVTNADGCTLQPDPVIVTILPPPAAAISGPAVICDEGCVTLTAPSGFGYTYQWQGPGNTPIPGAVLQTLDVCDTNLLPAYTVVVTDANGCTATSAPFTVSLANSPVFTITVAPDDCEGTPATLTVTPVQPNVTYAWSNGGTGPSITVLQAGTYTAVGTNVLTGCKSSASAVIHPLPDLCLVPAGCYETCNPDTICGPAGLFAYQWNLNGVPIPGETGECLIVTQSGTYSLTGTTEFGCSLTTDSLMLTVVDCGCDQLEVSAEPSETDSCCYTLSLINNYGSLYGLVIHTGDADLDIDIGSLDPSLGIFSITNNSVGLVSATSGDPLPEGAVNDFLTFCFDNIQNSPQQVIFDWYDFEFEVVCSDTLTFACPVEPDCFYLLSDSIYCENKLVKYQMTVCNPVDADFDVAYIVLAPVGPSGVIVTPTSIDETANPIQPGECRTYTLTLSGPGIAGQDFCYKLTAHAGNPLEDPLALCCSVDTTYCLPIPDCDPCDNIGVEVVESPAAEDPADCCHLITLFNNYAAGYFDGIDLCMLTPGVTMTMNNPFGSGWTTASYSPTVISLNVAPPLGTSLPLGTFQLPVICVDSDQSPPQLLEIKWMDGDEVVCRDTIQLGCEPPCGFLADETILCDPATGSWVYNCVLTNTSVYTMGEVHFAFNSPAGLNIYDATIPVGSLLPGGTFPISLTLGPPAKPGDTICFTVALHALNDDAAHTNCCTFEDCFVLPECPVDNVLQDPVVFPNPTTGKLSVQMTPEWGAPARFRLLDLLGRTVADLEFPDAAGQEILPLDFSSLAKGVYYLVMESDGKRWMERVVVGGW